MHSPSRELLDELWRYSVLVSNSLPPSGGCAFQVENYLTSLGRCLPSMSSSHPLPLPLLLSPLPQHTTFVSDTTPSWNIFVHCIDLTWPIIQTRQGTLEDSLMATMNRLKHPAQRYVSTPLWQCVLTICSQKVSSWQETLEDSLTATMNLLKDPICWEVRFNPSLTTCTNNMPNPDDPGGLWIQPRPQSPKTPRSLPETVYTDDVVENYSA